jgi:hypothetical protein
MALPSGLCSTLGNPIGIRFVGLGLVVMPATELVLLFNLESQVLDWIY